LVGVWGFDTSNFKRPTPNAQRPRATAPPWQKVLEFKDQRKETAGFTLLEIMMAILIFSMVLAAIYSTWMAIIKGSKISLDTAASVQRSRIAMKALEDAFVTSVMFTADIKDYAFLADTSGDMAFVSMVSRLPASFPGVGRYGDQVVRRITFSVEPGLDGNELKMTQAPMLQDTNRMEAYTLVLAKDVTMFHMEFWDMQNGEWLDEWTDTNQMPRLVKISLGMGRSSGAYASDPRDLTTKLVAMPSVAVQGDIQGAGPPMAMPGLPPPRPGQPGAIPNPAQPGSAFPGNRGYRNGPQSGRPIYPGNSRPNFFPR
jgi:type II secretion system protein J